jgi:hypothetical protein
VVRQSADCAGRPAKAARYATPGPSVPSMRWSHPSSECARSAAVPERDGRGSSIALTNTASNNAPKPTNSENIDLLQFSPQGLDAGKWRSYGQSKVKRFTPHAEAASHRRLSRDTSRRWEVFRMVVSLCRHKRAPPNATRTAGGGSSEDDDDLPGHGRGRSIKANGAPGRVAERSCG